MSRRSAVVLAGLAAAVEGALVACGGSEPRLDFGDPVTIASHLREVTAPITIRRALRDLTAKGYRIPVTVLTVR